MDSAPDIFELKRGRVIDVVRDTAQRILMETLEQSVGAHYCFNDWQRIAAAVVDRINIDLQKSYPLGQILSETDLYSAKGSINMESVINALKETESRMKNQGDKDQINHLTEYLAHVYKALKPGFKR